MAKTKPAPMTPPVTMPKGGGGNLKKGGMKGGKKCRTLVGLGCAIACLAALSGCGTFGANAGVVTPPMPTMATAPVQTLSCAAPQKIYTPVALPSQREK